MKPEPTNQKLRGGYYTPKLIADFLARWAVQTKDVQILEPSCGDGVFLQSSIERLASMGSDLSNVSNQILGIEIDPEEATKALESIKAYGVPESSNPLHVGDFFSYCKDHLLEEYLLDSAPRKRKTFDVVIGNPPFIRYQHFPEEYRKNAFDIMKRAGLQPNRLTNMWVPFVIASALLVKENGRFAMVLPAELFQVKYAAETREFLSNFFSKITIITFQKLAFKGVQQEIILFLGERNGAKNSGIRIIELNSSLDLAKYSSSDCNHTKFKPNNHSEEKWTKYYLDAEELLLLESLKNHPKLTVSGEVIDVDVGVVTGENSYFVLRKEAIDGEGIHNFTQRIVSRSAHLDGIVFSESDYIANVKENRPAFLLKSKNLPTENLPEPLKKYVTMGERIGVNKGYKCRIRKTWHVVPSVWIPDAFMLRQVHGYPKLILNEASATCTDTVHRVRFKEGVDGRAVSAAFLNSLSLAFAEITGRSYGGGVLTFEPSEAERIPIPLKGAEELDFEQIDDLIRKNNIDAVLNITDKKLLHQHLGLSVQQIDLLRNIWEKLRDRRIKRNFGK